MNYTTQHDLISQPSSVTFTMANREVLRITAAGIPCAKRKASK